MTRTRGKVLHYLSIVAEEEANAIVCESPFKEFVVWWKVEAEWRSAQQAVEFGGVDEGVYSFVAFCYIG